MALLGFSGGGGACTRAHARRHTRHHTMRQTFVAAQCAPHILHLLHWGTSTHARTWRRARAPALQNAGVGQTSHIPATKGLAHCSGRGHAKRGPAARTRLSTASTELADRSPALSCKWRIAGGRSPRVRRLSIGGRCCEERVMGLTMTARGVGRVKSSRVVPPGTSRLRFAEPADRHLAKPCK